MTTITSRDNVVNVIKSTNGKAFTVLFIKRTDGSIRRMNCRLGVKKHLKGGDSTLTNANVIPVFDMTKKAYRCIPIENIIQVRFGGNTYEVK